MSNKQREAREKALDHWLPCPTDGWALTFSQAEKLRKKWLRAKAKALKEGK